MTIAEKVRAFHQAAGIKQGTIEDKEFLNLRFDLIVEELRELCEAINYDTNTTLIGRVDKVKLLDAIVDLCYVLVGFSEGLGWDFDEALRRIHESNMTKVSGGEVLVREDGKILKPKDYVAPNLSDLVGRE